MRLKAKNPTGSQEYYQEPYTLQHFWDWLRQFVVDVPTFCWFAFRHFTSRRFRMEKARAYNRALFGNIPTSQIYTMDGEGKMRPLRPEERTWPE
jgi:hypothetical protein